MAARELKMELEWRSTMYEVGLLGVAVVVTCEGRRVLEGTLDVAGARLFNTVLCAPDAFTLEQAAHLRNCVGDALARRLNEADMVEAWKASVGWR